MRWKWFVGICGLVLLAGITVGYALLSAFDFNELKPAIQRAVTSVTGRDLEIEGDIRCKIGLTPTIVIGDVRFQNAPWGSEPWMMQARELRLRVALVPLLHRNIRIRELAVLEPELLLEKDPSGTFNTALLQTAEEPSAQQEEHFDSLVAAMVTMLAFDGVRVERGRLIFREGSSAGHTIEVDLLEARASSATSPIFLMVRGSYRKVPFEASGTLAPIATLLDPDIPHAVEVAGRLGEI